MPPHITSATSTVAILFTAPVGVAAHQLQGDIDWSFAIPLAVGGLVGGQIGPRIARRMTPRQVLLVLALSLLGAALALALKHVPGL